MSITYATVYSHAKKIYKTHGVHGRGELAALFQADMKVYTASQLHGV